MALRHSKAVTFRASTLSDAVDGSNAPPGAMLQLANLIPDPSTQDIWVPRPGAQQATNFPGFSMPKFVSALLVVGDVAYGMIASARNPGFDEPFAYNIATNSFYPVSGVTANNVPASPAETGDWTPPIVAQVASRIIVTHPGFPGGALKFGWFDISNLSRTVTGNLTAGSAVITGNPSILGFQPGLVLTDANIPPGTSILSVANFVLTENGTTHSNTTLDGLGSIAGLAVGQTIVGGATLGIPAGTTIVSVGIGSVTMSQAATASATGSVTFGGATITMSANATNSVNGEAIAVAGGLPTAPQWGAGDTNVNNLPSVPVGVAQFNGRAYYALGVNGIVFSDSLLPCQVSNNLAVQALTTNDGLAVTAIGPLMQYAALTGGIVQGLIAFEGVSKMQQITGDQVTSNLSMNALPVATGTLAPLSIVPTELGLAFVSPQGLRIIGFIGNVSPPIGEAGKGVTVPMIYSVHPSRICAAAAVDVIRISMQNGLVPNTPNQEFWFGITRKVWSGPHTFPASSIQPWRNSFVMAASGIDGKLWQSDVSPSNNTGYTENGTALTWTWQTLLFPDNAEVAMNCIVETAMSFALLAGSPVSISAVDERGAVLDTVSVFATGQVTLWGQFLWDQANWGGNASAYQQYPLNWHLPIVFKQMSIMVSGTSGYPLRVGNLYAKYEVLGYKLQQPLLTGATPASGPQQLLSDTGVPLTSDTGAPLTGL